MGAVVTKARESPSATLECVLHGGHHRVVNRAAGFVFLGCGCRLHRGAQQWRPGATSRLQDGPGRDPRARDARAPRVSTVHRRDPLPSPRRAARAGHRHLPRSATPRRGTKSGARYAAQGRRVEPERRVSTFPARTGQPLPGEMSLLGDEPTNEKETIINDHRAPSSSSASSPRRDRRSRPRRSPCSAPPTRASRSEGWASSRPRSMDVVRDRKLSVRISGREHLTSRGLDDARRHARRLRGRRLDKPNETATARSPGSRRAPSTASRRRRGGRVLRVRRRVGDAGRVRAPGDGADPRDLASAARAARSDRRARRLPAEPAPRRSPTCVERSPSPRGRPRARPDPDAIKPTDDQVAELHRLLAELATAQPDVDWKARCAGDHRGAGRADDAGRARTT